MTEIEVRGNAMLQELAMQRTVLGDRAVALAAENALLQAQVKELTDRVALLEKQKAPQ